ncbi:RNA-binding protein 42 [Cimex lectularius]|uniref:RNA-binding protein 42 n=1 Tax=Cimex lectularius TaxID=79782 RepID=A0A8I6TEB8_CIMLE|nr:RNA-binding protein 42 [Cimex lectularius]
MSGLAEDKFKKMQDEMSRFEEEIGLPIPEVGAIGPRVISTSTFNDAQKQLAAIDVQRPNLDYNGSVYRGSSLPQVGSIPGPPIPPSGLPPTFSLMVPPMVQIQSNYTATTASTFQTPSIPQTRFIPPPPPQVTVPDDSPKSSNVPAVLSGSPMMYVNPQMDLSIYETEPTPVNPILPNQETLEEAKRMQKLSKKAAELSYHLSRRKEKKNKKLIRTAGGQTWEDQTLAEWEDDDFRLFCGDLGNDVTDEVLTRAFSKYSSFLKARVVRDKRTNKTKGFGFVSFKDPQDFIRATKEMNGRYVGSRPIKLRKSSWKSRSMDVVRKKEKEKATLINMLTGR